MSKQQRHNKTELGRLIPSPATGLIPGLILSISLLIAGCGNDQNAADTPNANAATPSQASSSAKPPQTQDHAIQGRDLDAIQQRGQLRIIVPAMLGGNNHLPRAELPVSQQQAIAEDFAHKHGLKPILVPVAHFKDMIPALRDGKGDLIAANLTITDSRRAQIDFSVPLTQVKETVLVTRNSPINSLKDLKDKTLLIDPATSFWARMQARQKRDGFKLQAPDPKLSDEQQLDQLTTTPAQADAVIRDSNIADMYLRYRDDLKRAFDLKGRRDIAWGLPQNAPQLKAALNEYLHLEAPGDDAQNTLRLDDLNGIQKTKTLRVLLRNNAASYFLYKGDLMGFEYEMAQAFAKAQKLRLEVIVPPDHRAMLDWLKQGRGDIAVGFLEDTPRRRAEGIAFSRPYHYGQIHIVARPDDPLSQPEQLAGREIVVRRSSAYWDALKKLQAQGIALKLRPAPEDSETEELISQVAEGQIPLTVADSHLLDIELALGTGVKAAITLPGQHAHAVAVRPNNPKLQSALNRFIKKTYKGVLYNILYKKYFKDRGKIRRLAKQRDRVIKDGKLSPYQQLTQHYAERYGFDWRLITSQMYQESRFDPKAVSFAGAKGLLQVMPKTGKSMGFTRLEDPETGIHAGVKYLDWVRDRFETELPFAERLWFSLASYNAGYGHVQDARRLAKAKGWDPDRWLDNTERAMLLLAKKRYYRKARYGYVRGKEPVHYVRQIKQRFEAYVTEIEALAQAQEHAQKPTHKPQADKAQNAPNAQLTWVKW